MSSFATPFAQILVPGLWQSLIAVFGQQVEYWPDGDAGLSIYLTVIWKEGVEDEDVSPGRYSHVLIQNVDLGGPPKRGDVIYKDGALYDVVTPKVDATNYSTVVVQDRNETF